MPIDLDGHGRHRPIDMLFRSLAEADPDGCAVLLSGAGTDGVEGLRAVRDAGGIAFVQEPAEAEFDALPRAAVDAGAADIVLPAGELAQRVIAMSSGLDSGAFEALAQQALPRLFADRRPNHAVRVWIPGCSTGEEAYSLAMVLAEHADTLDAPPPIQVFATDLDERDLVVAREGRYATAIEADVSAERLRRFFTRTGDHYSVTPRLRALTIFARHDLWRDPPFSRIDLLSCRNVLSSVEHDLQERLLHLFRYSLRPGGYLLLGSAESPVGAAAEAFETISRRHHIYRSSPTGTGSPMLPPMLSAARAPEPAHRPPPGYPSAHALHRDVLEQLGPPSVLVTEAGQIVSLSESAGRYLLLPGGRPTDEIVRLVRPELRQPLRSALLRAARGQQPDAGAPVSVQLDGGPRRVQLLLQPAPGRADDSQRLALVVFLDHGPAAAAGADAREIDGRDRQGIEAEMSRARDDLRTAQEQAESTAEELRVANEELQSINEEYRASTEELETSKEELHSINEELQTVNQELKSLLDRATKAHIDLENLIDAADVGMLVLDAELRIQRLTPRLRRLFHAQASDVGRPIGELRSRLQYTTLESDVRHVLDGQVFRREVEDDRGTWYSVGFRPYYGPNAAIEGAILTFADVSDLKRAESGQRAAREHAELIVDTVRESLLILDDRFRVKSASQSFYDAFLVSPAETEGRSLFELGGGRWNIPELRGRLANIAARGEAFDEFEVTQDFEAVGRRTMRLNARRFRQGRLILLAIEDVTERRASEEALGRSERRLGLALDAARMITCEWKVGADEIALGGHFEALAGAPAPRTVQDALALLHPDDRPAGREALASIVGALADVGHAEFRVVGRDGETRWLEGWAARVDQLDGARLTGVAVGISERKFSEIRLRELMSALERRVAERTAQVRALGSQLTMAEHQERQRIAQVLHDDLQQLLYSIQVKLMFLREHAERNETEPVIRNAREAEQWLMAAVAAAQRLSVDLSPQVLHLEGLPEALRWLGGQMGQLHGLDVQVHGTVDAALPMAVRVLLYQSVRELLFNVVKHAGVRTATVRLHQTDTNVQISVSDDGAGFDPRMLEEHTGFGVLSVRHRVSLFGGRATIDSAPRAGTRVTLHVPLDRLEESAPRTEVVP